MYSRVHFPCFSWDSPGPPRIAGMSGPKLMALRYVIEMQTRIHVVKGTAIQGPAARMRCRRCHKVFSVRPGRLIAHDRRQGAVYLPCDGELVANAPAEGCQPA